MRGDGGMELTAKAIRNLLRDLPASLAEEEVTSLLSADGVRIERIVSTGQASPAGFWYDQEEYEWVLVLRGRGVIEYDDGTALTLQTGDSLHLPPRTRHRVRETSAEEPTVWLAVFWRAEGRGRQTEDSQRSEPHLKPET